MVHTTITDSSTFLNIRTVARMLGTTEAQIRAAIRNGHLPALRLGPRTTRIPMAALQALTQREERTGPAAENGARNAAGA